MKCYEPTEPEGGSAIGWQHVANKAGASGSVVTVSGRDPIVAANIDFSFANSPQSTAFSSISDKLGLVAVDSLKPGKYLLRVRRIGFRPAADTVVSVKDSGLVFTAVLSQQNMMLDECGSALIEKRVPWWIRK